MNDVEVESRKEIFTTCLRKDYCRGMLELYPGKLELSEEEGRWWSEDGSVRKTGGRYPCVALDESIGLVTISDSRVGNLVRPRHSGSLGAGTNTLVLGEKRSVQTEVGEVPVEPASRVDDGTQVGFQMDAHRVFFPGATQIREEDGGLSMKGLSAVEIAVLEWDTGIRHRTGPSLSCVSVLLSHNTGLRKDITVLEHSGGVAEDEIHCPEDHALAVVLAECIGVQRILVGFERALEKRRFVGTHSQCNSLKHFGSCCVPHCDAFHHEPRSRNCCTQKKN